MKSIALPTRDMLYTFPTSTPGRQDHLALFNEKPPIPNDLHEWRAVLVSRKVCGGAEDRQGHQSSRECNTTRPVGFWQERAVKGEWAARF